MTHPPLRTIGQQFGRRSWAEPWKIKMVEPIRLGSIRRTRAGAGPEDGPRAQGAALLPGLL
jgi:tyrosine phenol-lyase